MTTGAGKPVPHHDHRRSLDEAQEYGRSHPWMQFLSSAIGSFENPFYEPPQEDRECSNCGAPNQHGTCTYCREPVR